MAELVLDIGDSATIGRLATLSITAIRTDENTIQFRITGGLIIRTPTNLTIYNLKSNSSSGDIATQISDTKFELSGLKNHLNSSKFGDLKITGVIQKRTYTATLNYTSIRFAAPTVNFNGTEYGEVYFNDVEMDEIYIDGKRVY